MSAPVEDMGRGSKRPHRELTPSTDSENWASEDVRDNRPRLNVAGGGSTLDRNSSPKKPRIDKVKQEEAEIKASSSSRSPARQHNNKAKPKKQASSDSDEDEEEEGEGGGEKGKSYYTPAEMLGFLEQFEKLSQEKSLQGKTMKSLSTAVSHWIDATKPDVDKEKFLASYRKYLHIGQAHMNLKLTGELIKSAAASPYCLSMYPDYPAKLPTTINIYAEMNGLSMFSKETIEKYRSDEAGKKIAEEKRFELQKEQHKALEEFRDMHITELSSDALESLNRKIQLIKHKLDPNSKSSTSNGSSGGASGATKGRKKNSKPKSAFDIFVLTKRSSYPDLDEEKLLKKLKKKFDKLDAEKLAFLNALAMSS